MLVIVDRLLKHDYRCTRFYFSFKWMFVSFLSDVLLLNILVWYCVQCLKGEKREDTVQMHLCHCVKMYDCVKIVTENARKRRVGGYE